MEGELELRRWRRFGHDRLYVIADPDEQLGWVDLKTDEVHAEEGQADVVRAAADKWRAAAVTEASPAPPVELAEPLPAPEEPWIDLATNEPGAEARQQALRKLAAAPVKNTLARMIGVHTPQRGWRIGAKGEELVADELRKVAKKDARWRFLHAVPVGRRGSDIDHVIIGPGGVFSVNAKHHPGADIRVSGDTFLVNGDRQPYVRNSRHEAARASRLLSEKCGFPVPVHGLIVTVNAKDVTIKTAPKDVQVLYRMHLAKWLLRHGEVLNEEAINAIFQMARRSTTWV